LAPVGAYQGLSESTTGESAEGPYQLVEMGIEIGSGARLQNYHPCERLNELVVTGTLVAIGANGFLHLLGVSMHQCPDVPASVLKVLLIGHARSSYQWRELVSRILVANRVLVPDRDR